ncbi:interleukin-20 receptor subunit alpha-like [Carettochelys insculpta]|uniref:interleukin-20 receptor subunit alpha-like n=1 Tax=Carettochelys insculpta TaxID=44489 RepID=UPI003EB9399C
MRRVLRVLLLLFHQTLLLGMLSPPQNVRLTSENFHILLAWEPGSSSGNDNEYEVESRQRSSNWTKVAACWRNSTGLLHACKLYFEDIYQMYWARVRATDRTNTSEWAISNELQLYRDTSVGPPNLTLMLVNENLIVNLSVPLTPYCTSSGVYKSVQEVLPTWKYQVNLYEEGVDINQVTLQPEDEITSHTFDLRPNTNYCVTAKVLRQKSKVSVQCIKAPEHPADFHQSLAIALAALLTLLLSTVVVCFLKLYVYPSLSKMPFPQTLAILNEELNVNLWNKSPAHDLEGACSTLISVVGFASSGNSPEPHIQLLPGGCQAWEEEGYCANGFGPGLCESLASPRSLGQLDFAGLVNSEAPLPSAGEMQDGLAGEGSYSACLGALLPGGQRMFPEQQGPESAGLAREADMSHRVDLTYSEIPIPPHLQGYSKSSSPVAETRRPSQGPLGAAHSLRDLKKKPGGKQRGWPPLDGVDIPLSSVKLQGNKETRDHMAPSPRCLYSHTAHKTMKDKKADLAWLDRSYREQQQFLPVNREWRGLPKCTEQSEDPQGEPDPKTDGRKVTMFPSYESRPQVLAL